MTLLLKEYNNIGILDRVPLPPIQQSPNIIDENPYLYTSGHVSDTGSRGSRKSLYGACGYSRDYWRSVTGDYHLRPSPSGLSPGSPSNLGGSPGRNLLHPSGSPASEASKSPQRSPRSQRHVQVIKIRDIVHKWVEPCMG